jgi:hypothetical protein
MKTQRIIIILALAAVAAGGWFGRAAWRAHRRLVTLHVRNAPLADVLRAIERQTWENVRFDQKLTARITLSVDSAPLDQVLDMVSAKAGARWEKTFAVYDSASALAGLETVLRGEAKLDAAGWTNIAPRFNLDEMPALSGMPKTEEALSGMPKFVGAPAGKMVVKDGGAPRMITMSPNGEKAVWSPERLVLEATLMPRVGGEPPAEATAESAAGTAKAVHGKWHLYYALERSPVPMGSMGHLHFKGSGPGPGGDHRPALGDIGAAIERERRTARLRQMSHSPEEQVERARQNQGGNRQFEIENTETIK